ncbi:uncharacterized protein [Neodiprion pinetum]|uniref:uncharacterized protein n=1 Tax=Neodiprion pinetum TaxID=441929 RepID=UPI001EDD2DE6|nr:uncharacterized protein LOC124217031 [Neodiprion pinetum]
MMRSKATAALMKLKEIDRKYKMKCSEDRVKRQSSLSDISAVDSADELSKPAGESGSGDAIVRPKLDVRMPEAYLERSEGRRGQEASEPTAELVMIFDCKSGNKSPRQESANYQRDGPAAGGAENQEARKRSETPSLQVESEREAAGKLTTETETSVSEEVPEVVRSIAPFSRPVSDHPDVPSLGEEITMKSVESIIDGEERRASTLDADSPTLMASAGYSDDFVRSTLSAETLSTVEEDLQAQEPEDSYSPSGSYRPQRSSPTSMQLETKKLTQLVAPKVIRVLSKCDAGLDPGLSNYVKASTNGNTASPVCLLRSSQPSTDRSDEIRRMNRVKRRPAVSSRDSSGLSSKEDPETGSRNEVEIITKQDETLAENRRIVFLMEGKNPQSTNPTEMLQRHERVLEKVESKSVRNRARIETPVSLVGELDLQTRSKDWEKEESAASAAVQQPERVPSSEEASAGGVRLATGVEKHRSKKVKTEERHRAGKSRTRENRKLRHRRSAGVEEETDAKRVAGDVERLRRRLKELLLEQERDQLRPRVRRYLQQIMDEDDGFGDCDAASSSSGVRRNRSLRSFFKPLDLPNVAAFKRPDFEDDKTANLDCESRLHLRMIHERVLGIRHWLKQQFVLYRDYSNLASTINATYIPVTLKETKKMIRETQRFRDIIIRERRCHVT